MKRHFLRLNDLSTHELNELIERAIAIKADFKAGKPHRPLAGKMLAMVFEKSSTRTRVSFATAMAQLGGTSIDLTPEHTQLGRGEPIKDTARVLSGMTDAIMMRTDRHDKVEEMAHYATVPVINGLTDATHPCQLLADVQTYVEHKGPIKGAQVAWIGDGNNVCNSFMEAAERFGFNLNIASPKGYEPDPALLQDYQAYCALTESPQAAVSNADLVVTDTWASMGQDKEKDARMAAFQGYCVDQALMNLAHPEALFMHCLPAYRGLEVSEEVFEGAQSVVFAEAENRLHAQKALLEFLL